MERIKLLVEGGAATPSASLGQKLGPLGINPGQVLAKVNAATQEFKGIKLPVLLVIDPATKQFEVEVGSPPVSQLLLREAGVKKGTQGKEVVGNVTMEQVRKVAEEKDGTSLAGNIEKRVNEVLGTCASAGITIDGLMPKEVLMERLKKA